LRCKDSDRRVLSARSFAPETRAEDDNLSNLLFLNVHRAYWQGADIALSEARAADAENTIKACAIVLKGYSRRQFHQFRITELLEDASVEFVGDVGRRFNQFICQLQRNALARIESRAGLIVVQPEELLLGHSHFSAHGRIDVHSKEAPNVRGGASADQALQF
jgi:hypothetical protein